MDWFVEHFNALIQIVSVTAGVIGFFLYIRVQLTSLLHDVAQIKEQQRMLMESLKQLNTILTQIAVQDTRINMIEKDIDELRHNKGFIN